MTSPHKTLLILTLALALSMASPLVAAPVGVPDTGTQEPSDTDAWSDFAASVLDWLGFGEGPALDESATDPDEEAEPLPGMGFEIEPNG